MEELSRCGYRCDLCAARSDNDSVRRKMVAGWRRYFGLTGYTAENARCDGCLHDGRLADKNCPVRPCVIARGIENCAHCDDYPCDMLKKLWCSEEELRNRFGDIPDDDFNLCMRQFVSKPRLREIRRQLGKE